MSWLKTLFASILSFFKKAPAPATGVQSVPMGGVPAPSFPTIPLAMPAFPAGTRLIEQVTAASLYGFAPPPGMVDPVYMLNFGWYPRASVTIAQGPAPEPVPGPAGVPDKTDHFGTLLEFNGSVYYFDAPGKMFKMPVDPGWYTLAVADGYDEVHVSVNYSTGESVVDFSGWISKTFKVARKDTLTVSVASKSKGTIERQITAAIPGQ